MKNVFRGDECLEEVRPSIFRIETKWSKKVSSATGFVVGKLRDSKKLVIATAKHVLDLPKNETVWWKVQQFDEHGAVARQTTFGTNAELKGDLPYRTHNILDVGLCALPSFADDKPLLAYEDESPMRLIDPCMGITAGTRVGWAGYPWFVEQALGFPQLCYFEGVISAMVNHPDKRIYLVDGHAAKGVSGGPVWWWSEERNRLEVVGIVSEYSWPDPKLPELPEQPDLPKLLELLKLPGLPGLCFFEPINPVGTFLEHWQEEEVKDFLYTKCGD